MLPMISNPIVNGNCQPSGCSTRVEMAYGNGFKHSRCTSRGHRSLHTLDRPDVICVNVDVNRRLKKFTKQRQQFPIVCFDHGFGRPHCARQRHCVTLPYRRSALMS
jgi:hypothetical protein